MRSGIQQDVYIKTTENNCNCNERRVDRKDDAHSRRKVKVYRVLIVARRARRERVTHRGTVLLAIHRRLGANGSQSDASKRIQVEHFRLEIVALSDVFWKRERPGRASTNHLVLRALTVERARDLKRRRAEKHRAEPVGLHRFDVVAFSLLPVELGENLRRKLHLHPVRALVVGLKRNVIASVCARSSIRPSGT